MLIPKKQVICYVNQGEREDRINQEPEG